MKKTVLIIVGIILSISLVILLSLFRIQSINDVHIRNLWSNIKFISTSIFTLLPFLLILIIFFLLCIKKWAFRVEKLSVGGFDILFDNPNQIFIKQVQTFLDTKRTVFRINLEKDNFYETLDSYYEIYKFLRDEIKVLGSTKKKKRAEKTLNLYSIANQMIKVLNEFLTKHQTNYRRWYTYIEKSDEAKFYLTPIGELQKEYMNYNQLCIDFGILNDFFVRNVANVFDIDIEKWE